MVGSEPGVEATLMPPVIDAHHHFWDPARLRPPWTTEAYEPLGQAFGPEDFEPELRREGMTGSVLMQTLASDAEAAALLAMAREVSWLNGVVVWIDLTASEVAATIEALQAGPGGELLVGLRHRVHEEPDRDWLLRDDVRRGLAAIQSAGLVFDLGVRTRELPAAYEICRAFPRLSFVLEHLAKPPIASGDLSKWGRTLLPLADLPNVHATLSGLVTEADWRTWSIDELRHPVELAVDAFGPRRLMLASDWPVCLLAGSYSDAIDSVRYLLAELPEHEQAEVRGGTAARVYRLRDNVHQAGQIEGTR